MTIEFFDPVGDVRQSVRETQRTVENVHGLKVGYVFNQHISAAAFWEAFEQAVGSELEPSHVDRVYKPAHSVTAARADIDRIVRETDYALVGVGA